MLILNFIRKWVERRSTSRPNGQKKTPCNLYISEHDTRETMFFETVDMISEIVLNQFD